MLFWNHLLCCCSSYSDGSACWDFRITCCAAVPLLQLATPAGTLESPVVLLLFLFFSWLRLLGLENSSDFASWPPILYTKINNSSHPSVHCTVFTKEVLSGIHLTSAKWTIHPTLLYIVLLHYRSPVWNSSDFASAERLCYTTSHPTVQVYIVQFTLQKSCQEFLLYAKTNKLSYFASWPPMLYTKLTIHPTILYILQFTSL